MTMLRIFEFQWCILHALLMHCVANHLIAIKHCYVIEAHNTMDHSNNHSIHQSINQLLGRLAIIGYVPCFSAEPRNYIKYRHIYSLHECAAWHSKSDRRVTEQIT